MAFDLAEPRAGPTPGSGSIDRTQRTRSACSINSGPGESGQMHNVSDNRTSLFKTPNPKPKASRSGLGPGLGLGLGFWSSPVIPQVSVSPASSSGTSLGFRGLGFWGLGV